MPETPPFDRGAAQAVKDVDPRVRHLAAARWRLRTGGSHMLWLSLGEDNPAALIEEARDWLRAAVAAGILPPPAVSASPITPPTDGDPLRQRMDGAR